LWIGTWAGQVTNHALLPVLKATFSKFVNATKGCHVLRS
jgi:hypothetical protein